MMKLEFCNTTYSIFGGGTLSELGKQKPIANEEGTV